MPHPLEKAIPVNWDHIVPVSLDNVVEQLGGIAGARELGLMMYADKHRYPGLYYRLQAILGYALEWLEDLETQNIRDTIKTEYDSVDGARFDIPGMDDSERLARMTETVGDIANLTYREDLGVECDLTSALVRLAAQAASWIALIDGEKEAE